MENKLSKLASNSINIQFELLDVEFTPFQLWFRPWMQNLTILGIESGNFMFHVIYISRERIHTDKWTLRIEILGIKNFKWCEDE